MNSRSLVFFALLMAIACRREVPDPDMVAATQTTVSDTSGTMTATTTGESAGAVTAMTPGEKEFVVQAGFAGLAEVRLSEIALQRASRSDTKTLAQRMITDHGRGNQELRQLATSKGLAVPTTLDEKHREAVDRLQNANEAQFDRLYVAQMAEDHQKVVTDFENAERMARDPDLRAWITKTLPVLREHRQHARSLQTRAQ